MKPYMKLAGPAAVAITALCLMAALPKIPQPLPAPYATNSADNPPHVVAKPPSAELHAPQGFAVKVWASGFHKPRFLLQGEHNEILLADSGDRIRGGAVYVFPNGNPARRKILLRGLTRPYGLALWRNYLYIGEPQAITRYAYDATNFKLGAGEEVISLKGFGKDHWTRSLLFDREGKKLYVGVGSGANVETGEDPRRAAINRYNPDGTGHELFATGMRNPIGLHWHPGSNVLWAAVQERDELGNNLVPDYFTHVEEGGFYGWPYSYIGQHKDPRIEKQRPDLVAKAIVPDELLPSHVAVLDFTFYTGKAFPQQYQEGAFLALHGSWNRAARDGYAVAFVPFQAGKPSGPAQNFLTGWMTSPESDDVWGRPVAVFQMKDGSLLVSDDAGGKLWRISYSGVQRG